jgi:PleD family two-component response regulator
MGGNAAKAERPSLMEEHEHELLVGRYSEKPMLGQRNTRYFIGRMPYRKPTRVLIADDSGTVRDIIKVFLALRGVCGEASDGLETIEKAGEFKPDLILLDFAMPNMNGAEAASVLRTR